MTLAPHLHLAAIIRGYLDTAASRTAGVPNIPVQRMDTGADVATPRIVVRADQIAASKRLRTFLITVQLETKDKHGSDDEPDQAATWLRAIDLRLRDDDAFLAHLAALSAEDKSGWELHDWSFPNPEDCRREESAATAHHTVMQMQIIT